MLLSFAAAVASTCNPLPDKSQIRDDNGRCSSPQIATFGQMPPGRPVDSRMNQARVAMTWAVEVPAIDRC
jgi:hypothetical protein